MVSLATYLHRYNLFCFMLLLGPTLMAQTQQTPTFSLEDCIEYAMSNNPELQRTALDRDQANADIGVTRSDGLPQVTGLIDIGNNFLIPQTFVPKSAFPDPENPTDTVGTRGLEFGTAYTGNAVLSVTQMLFDGSFFVGLEAARTYRQLSQKDLLQAKVNLVDGISKSYYLVLINNERKKTLTLEYYRLDSLLKNTSALWENGFVEKIDVSRVQVQFNNVKSQLRSLDAQILTGYQTLKLQMGMKVDASFEVGDKIEDVVFSFNEGAVGQFDINNRIEYSQLQTNKSLAYLDLKNNKVQYLPTLDAYLRVGANTGANSFSDVTNTSNWVGSGVVGVTLNIPIFDGLRKSYNVQKSRIQIKQVELAFEQLENSIDQEIASSQANLDANLANLTFQNENMELAREVYNVSQAKYEEGVGSNIEVLDASRDLQNAQINYYNALYDALVAKVNLEKALGILYQE